MKPINFIYLIFGSYILILLALAACNPKALEKDEKILLDVERTLEDIEKVEIELIR